MTLICPRCGRTSDKVEFIEAFCKDDYPIKLKLPRSIELERCTRCGKMKLRGEWTDFSTKKISDFILSKCKGDFRSASYDPEKQAASFVMIPSGASIDRIIPLEMKKTICVDCSRMSGGYYEAIIQLRGNAVRVRALAERIVKALSGKTFIAKEDEKDEGLDLYIGDSKAVIYVMSYMKLKALITKKLIGRDQGKRLYRTTFLIRL